MCPIVAGDGLYALIIPSLKRADLLHDGRFALHSYAAEENEDAFYVSGTAVAIEDRALRVQVEWQFRAERPDLDLPDDALREQQLFEFLIINCLVTRTTGHGDPHPRHEIWRTDP